MPPISFKKTITYAVLVSYCTQFCSPVIQAAEGSTESKSNWQLLHIPRIEAQEKAQKIIEDYENGKKSAVLSQSETYQYCLGIKAVGSQKDQVQIKLSRKEKGSTGAFETLYKESVPQGKKNPDQSTTEPSKDALLTLFKGASIHKFGESGTTLLIPGVAQVFIKKNGTVIVDRDPNTSFLSTYDLILNASEKLHIQSLAVAALTLSAKKTKLLGIVTTNDLCLNHAVLNLMGLRVHQMTGTGTLINQGRLELQGTADDPAILGVHKIINAKDKQHDLTPKIESTHLHITSENKGFMNVKDAFFSVTGKLHVDAVETSGNLFNGGQMVIREGKIHRYFINGADGEFTVLDQLTMSMFLNQGDIDVKNFLRFNLGHNMGTIRGKRMDISDSLTNEGFVSLRELSGKGTFWNHRSLEFLGHEGVISIYDFQNQTSMENKNAIVKGGMITVLPDNKKFENSHTSEIVCDLYFRKMTEALLGDNSHQSTRTPKTSVKNFGTIRSTSLVAGWGFVNYGLLETTSLRIPSNKVTLKGFTIEEGTFLNEGEALVKDLVGAGKFINKGNVQFTGTAQNPSRVHIREFEGDFSQASVCSLGDSSLIWKNVTWKGACKDYILPFAKTSWTFDHVIFADLHQPIKIQNQGSIDLKESRLSFDLLTNQGKLTLKDTSLTLDSLNNLGKMSISGGECALVKLLMPEGQNTSVISFQEKPCEFTVCSLDHQGGIIQALPGINQTLYLIEGKTNSKIIGENLTLKIDQSLTNGGDVAVWDLEGNGKFMNKGKLHFIGEPRSASQIIRALESLINRGHLFLNSGQYDIKNLNQLEGQVTLVDHEFTLTDNPLNTEPNRLLGAESDSLSKIKSNAPIKINFKENPLNLLDKIVQVQTPELTATLLGGSLLKDYVFETIVFINLCVKGNLSIPFEIKFRGGCLDIDGILSLGESNDRMGSLSATEGSLSIKAHEIDARWGMIYGFGPTKLKSTAGNIWVGAPKSETAVEEHVGSYTRKGKNGASIASKSTLEVESARGILLDYGQTFSSGTQHLKAANLILNTAGDISSSADIHVEAPEYVHRRDGKTTIRTTKNDHSSYCYAGWLPHHIDLEAPLSGPALIESLGNIYLTVNQFTNSASDILSGGVTTIKGTKLTESSAYIEEVCPYGRTDTYVGAGTYTVWDGSRQLVYSDYTRTSHTPNLWSLYPKTKTAKELRINIGSFIITGNMNSPLIHIESTGDGLIQGTPGSRITRPHQPIILNLTEIFTKNAQGEGLCQLTEKGEIQTKFPIGTPYHHPQAKTFKLMIHPNHPTVSPRRNSLNVINPLRHLPSNLFDLWLQKVMAEQTGKVHVRGGVRENSLALTLWQRNEAFREKMRQEIFSSEELSRHIREMMLLEVIQQVGGVLHQMTYLAIPPHEFNDAPGISGDVVEIENEGDLTIQDADIVAKDKLYTYAKDLLIESTVQTYPHEHGTYQVVEHPTSLTCTDGPANVVGREGFQMRGTDLDAAEEITVGSTEGSSSLSDVQMVRTEEHTHYEDGGWFGKDKTTTEKRTTVTSRPSTITSQNKAVTLLSGKAQETTVLGSHVKANQSIIFKGGKTAIGASVGYNTVSTETTVEGLFFKSRSMSRQSIPVFFGSSLQTPLIQFLTEGSPVVVTGSDIICLVFDASLVGDVFCLPTVGRLHYFQQATGRSPLSRYDIGCSGYQDVARPTGFQAKKVILNMDPAFKHVMTSVNWHPKAIEILGHYVEKEVHLDRHHTEWRKHYQVIPDGALMVIVLAVSTATANPGLFLGNGIFGAGTLSSIMFKAGFQTLCAGAATSLGRTGDPFRVIEEMISNKNLLHMATSVASTGLIHQLAPVLDVNLSSGHKSFMSHLQEQALRQVVKGGLAIVTGNQTIDKALKEMAKHIPLDTVAAYVSNNIGKLYENKKIGYGVHKMAHSLSGGVVGWVVDSTREGFLSGAQGALTAEVVGEALLSNAHDIGHAAVNKLVKEEKSLTPKNIDKAIEQEIQDRAHLAKLAAGSLAVATKSNVSIALNAAENAVDNNAVPFALAAVAPSAYAAAQAFIASPQFLLMARMTAAGLAAILAKDQVEAHYKKKHGNQHKKPFSSQGAQAGGQTSSSAGGMPNPDQDPHDKNGKNQKGRRLPPEERIGLKHKLVKEGQVKQYDLSKYTLKKYENGQKIRINPETGDKIFKERAGGRGHGGSAWKKFSKEGKIKETLDPNGVVLRVNEVKL